MKNKLQLDFEEYIDYCINTRRLRSETIRGYKESFRHFLAMMPEITSCEMLSPTVMNHFFRKLQTRTRLVGKGIEKVGVKDSTIRTYWNKLRSFFIWLVTVKKMAENPCGFKAPVQPVYDDSPAFKPEETDRIYTAIIRETKNSLILKRDIAMVSTLLYTGIRKGELKSLRLIDVDLQRCVILVRGATSKSKRNREIPIHPTLSNHLKEYFKERMAGKYKTEMLFVSSNEDCGLSSHGLKHWVNRLRVSSGIKFHLHQFRHTFACTLWRNKASSAIIQKLMGHTDLRMTDRYLRSTDVEDLRDDVLKLNYR